MPALPIAEVNVEAVSIFAVVVAITLGITYWASKQTKDATSFWAAGRGITGVQNGFAIAGDYMSAASFLGIAGLIFLFGFDGFLYSVGFLVAFLIVLYLLAERMRNSGKFTMADVLSFRLNERPARVAAALGTLVVAGFYLIAQMVGAGALIQALVGIDFNLAVLFTGGFMLVYVVFGGMLATTWVQIIKAALLMTATVVLSIFVLGKIGWNPIDIFDRAQAQSDDGAAYLAPGLRFTNPIDTISLGLALLLGTAGLPHILMRFFTVPDAKAARSSVVWAVGLIGSFYVMTTFLGFGARALLGEAGTTGAVDEAGNLAAPLLAQNVGGGAGSIGGDAFLAIIAAVAFATILAVVAGLVISASGAVAHDVWSNVIRKGRDSENEEVYGRADRGVRDRRDRDRDRDHRRLRPQRLLHGRARLRGRRERELPGAAAGVDLEAVQHDRRRDRRAARDVSARSAWCWSGPTCSTRSRSSPARADAAGDHLGAARVSSACILGTLLSAARRQGRARLRGAPRALPDRARRRGPDRGRRAQAAAEASGGPPSASPR